MTRQVCGCRGLRRKILREGDNRAADRTAHACEARHVLRKAASARPWCLARATLAEALELARILRRTHEVGLFDNLCAAARGWSCRPCCLPGCCDCRGD